MAPQGRLAIARIAVLLVDPNAVRGGGFRFSCAAFAVIFLMSSGGRQAGATASWWRGRCGIAVGLIPMIAAWGLPKAGLTLFAKRRAVPTLVVPIMRRSFLVLGMMSRFPTSGGAIRPLDLWPVAQGFRTLQGTDLPECHWTLPRSGGPRFSAAQAAVIPFLEAERVHRVDRPVLSHYDADGAGAWQRFIARMKVRELMAGQRDPAAGGRLDPGRHPVGEPASRRNRYQRLRP